MNTWLVVVVTMWLGAVSCGSKSRKKFVKPGRRECIPMKEKYSLLQLNCKKKVIYEVKAISSRSRGQCKGECQGLQAGVLAEVNTCYWKNSCTVRYSNTNPMILSDQAECVGERPYSLNVWYSCVKPSKVRYLDKRDKENDNNKAHTSDFGILISHDHYPWFYRAGIDTKLTVKPKSRRSKILYLAVKSMDLHEHDVVKVKAGEGGWEGVRRQTKYITSVAEATFHFYSSKSSLVGNGFVLCYYWAEDCEDLEGVDICKKVEKMKRKKKKPCRGKRNKKKSL